MAILQSFTAADVLFYLLLVVSYVALSLSFGSHG